MLFYLECSTFLLHFHTYNDIQILSLFCCCLIIFSTFVETGVVCILHIITSMMTICFYIDALLQEGLIAIIQFIEFTLQIDHRASFSSLIDNKQMRNARILCNLGIISTECRSNMYDTGTVFCSDIVTRDYSECLLADFHECIFTNLEKILRMCSCKRLHELRTKVIQFLSRFYPWHQLLIMHTH